MVAPRDIVGFPAEQEALRRLEELYRTLLEAVGCAVSRVDRQGRRTFVSDRAAEFYGQTKQDLLDGRFGESLLPQDRERAWQLLRETFLTGKPVRGIVTRHMIKGKATHIWSNWEPIKDSEGNVVELQITTYDITEQVRMRQQLELYSSRLSQAREEERLNVSRFLHNETMQVLIGVCHTIETILPSLQADASVKKLQGLRSILVDQIEALRKLTVSLRPPILDRMGLDKALSWYVEHACAPYLTKAEVHVGESWRRLRSDIEIRLFRIAQEAVNNALRHGHPCSIEVRLEIINGLLELEIKDDGQGFESSRSEIELLLNGKLGLTTMHEQARTLRAELQIYSKPRGGTRVLLRGSVERMEEASYSSWQG
jgi:PAS domain S-box-containing protein